MNILAFFGMPGILEIIIMVMCLAVFAGIVILVVVLTTRKASPNPNLYPCPACGQTVSLDAESCPHCGHPLQAESPGEGAEGKDPT
ncbi:MAG: zinc-ribbon domain-containing protein [Planctomycetes bacterium]|nr:zinc-ribbon domain-containing protein [Planctomycetota bacterium]